MSRRRSATAARRCCSKTTPRTSWSSHMAGRGTINGTAEVLSRVNQVLLDDFPTGRFVTMVYALWTQRSEAWFSRTLATSRRFWWRRQVRPFWRKPAAYRWDSSRAAFLSRRFGCRRAAVSSFSQTGSPKRSIPNSKSTVWRVFRSVGRLLHEDRRQVMLSANKSVIADEKGLLSLLSGARQLEAGLLARTKSSIPDVERLSTAAQRLKASVIRPLSDALAIVRASASEASTVSVESFVTSAAEAPSKEDVDFSSDDDPAEYLWRLALQATAVQMRADLPTQVQEAAAALQDLACLIAPTEGANSTASRLAELKEMAASLPFA